MSAIWRKVSRYKYWFVAGLGAVLIAVAASTLQASRQPQAPDGQMVGVTRDTITSVVSATGTIKPLNMVDISSKITGLVREVKVNENDRVQAGQVLLELDDTHLQAQVSQARARLADASANYERNQRLQAIGAVSDQQLDASRTDYNVAKASYDDAISQLNDTVIRAPINGVVIGKPIPAGQTVAPGISTPMVLMTVADMSKMQIDVQVDESDIGKVATGQKVSFTVDTYPGKVFTGVVSLVSAKANIQQNVVYYNVTVDVDGGGDVLKPTMTARVSIHIAEREAALTLPLTAVKTNNGQQYVMVLKQGKTQNVTVTTGLSSEEKIEILTGLAEGDEVFIPQVKQQSSPRNSGGGGMFRTPGR